MTPGRNSISIRTLIAVSAAFVALGWGLSALDHPGDDDVAALLGLDRDEDFAESLANITGGMHPQIEVLLAQAVVDVVLLHQIEARGVDAQLDEAKAAIVRRDAKV